MSIGTQALSLILVLPIILNKFSEEHILLYFVFTTLIGFQSYLLFGFQPTFIRLISQARSGQLVCGKELLKRLKIDGNNPLRGYGEDNTLLAQVLIVMRRIHIKLALIGGPVT